MSNSRPNYLFIDRPLRLNHMSRTKSAKANLSPQLPGAFVHLLLDVTSSMGVSRRELLSGSGITKTKLDQPYWYIDFVCFDALLRRAIRLTNDTLLPVKAGMGMKITNLGVVGFAALVSPTLGNALDLCISMVHHRCHGLVFTSRRVGSEAMLRVELTQAQHPLSDAAICFLMAGLASMAKSLTGRSFSACAHVTFARPSNAEWMHKVAGSISARFNTAHNQWTFPSRVLDWPLASWDAAAEKLALTHCKRLVEHRHESPDSPAALVSRLVAENLDGSIGMAHVASRMQMSARTLQRLLTQEGTSYSNIVEQMKCKRAEVMLSGTDAQVAAIAERLGYANPANFNRAFKRWYGLSPTAFKRRLAR